MESTNLAKKVLGLKIGADDYVTKPFSFLELLARGEALSRQIILDAVWDYDNPPLTRTVDMHVAKLRSKIEEIPANPRWIVTVHRMGYKFTG